MRIKHLAAAICFLLLSACATYGEKFSSVENVNSDEALIYFYRPKRIFGAAVSYDVKEGGNVAGTLYNGGFFPYKTSAGKKYIEAKTERKTSLVLPVENGNVYFVRGGVGWGVLMGRPTLDLIRPETALKEIRDCKMILKEKN